MGFLDPPYGDALADLIARLLSNSAARSLPQAFDIMCHEGILQREKPNFAPLLGARLREDSVRQGLGDVIAFSERAGSLSAGDRKALLAILP